jgi:hypothetical protein
MVRVWWVFAIIGVIAGLGAAPARAQIVNVQGALARAPAEDGAIGQIDLKFSWREGNNQLFDLGGAASVVVRRGSVLGLVLARGEYGTSRGFTLARKVFEHARTRIELDPQWRWEAFAQHEYDQFRRLSLRALAGTGPALQILDDKQFAVLAGAAYLYEIERLDTRRGTIDAGLGSTAHRASIYLTGHEEPGAGGAGVSIIETIYVQPRIDHPGDLRVLGELAVVTRLSARIALKDSFVVAFDRTPPDGVQRYDTNLEVALVVTL